MAYTILYTDDTKVGITVEDRTLNSETSLAFPGNYTIDYGKVISENFLHLLENFSNAEPPDNPVEGQLWYYADDVNNRKNELRVYNGAQWVSASGLIKSENRPSATSSVPGDLWVNLDSQQLYLFNGSSWILVGPEFSSGLFTGVRVETIVDTNNNNNTVFSVRINEKVIAIYSDTPGSFTPKIRIDGFSDIKRGINLSTDHKFYGVSEQAENLRIAGIPIPATNFLRSDQISTTNYRLNVSSNEGILLGSTSQTAFKIEGSSTVIQNSSVDSSLDIKMKKDVNSLVTVFKIKSNGQVSIGETEESNTTSIKFRINGDVKIYPEDTVGSTGILYVENTDDARILNEEGSIRTKGGISVAKSIIVGNDAIVQGSISAGDINPTSASSEIGNKQKYNNIHANNFKGNLQGNVTGSVTGNATTASRLQNAKTFSFTGDVSDINVPFDGQNDVNVNLIISNRIISGRSTTIDANNSDEILINKTTNPVGLYKISKANFLKTVPVMPVGMISPYGGQTAPIGWLLCDGSEIRKADYAELFNIIGHAFKPIQELADQGLNTFALPDLRGRFPLGVTNMGGTDSGVIVDSPLPTAVGIKSGKERVTLERRNLPDHEHTLTGSAGNQYYAVRVGDEDSIIDDNALALTVGLGTGGTQGIPTSGNVLSSQTLNRPVNVLNPYLAVNYIIYTGKTA